MRLHVWFLSMSCGWTLTDSGLSIQGGLLWSRNGAKVEVRVCISESPRGDAHWKSLQLWYWRLSEAIGWGNALHVLTVDQVSVFHYWRGDASPELLLQPAAARGLWAAHLHLTDVWPAAALSNVLQWGWVSAHIFISAPAPVLWFWSSQPHHMVLTSEWTS